MLSVLAFCLGFCAGFCFLAWFIPGYVANCALKGQTISHEGIEYKIEKK
jgi:hypothetical protein